MKIYRQSDWYPPSRYLFYPIYKLFRRKIGLGMYSSNMATWGTSGVLHAAIILPDYGKAAICGGIFLTIGTASTLVKVIEKRVRKNNLEKLAEEEAHS